MKNLVLYYSRSGNTRFVAEEIARNLKADIEEIEMTEGTRGPIGFVKSCINAAREKPVEINSLKSDIKKYDRIFIGQPVWAGKMNPAIRAMLAKCDFKGKKIALFCAMGGDSDDRCLSQTKEALKESEVIGMKRFQNPSNSPELTKENVKAFLEGLSTAAAHPQEPEKAGPSTP